MKGLVTILTNYDFHLSGGHRMLVGKPEEKRPLGDPEIDGRIILRCIFR
jgi:hypothetical protein